MARIDGRHLLALVTFAVSFTLSVGPRSASAADGGSERALGPPIPYSGPRLHQNLALRAAPTMGAERHEALHEGRAYWNAKRAWHDALAEELPPPDMLRAISEAVYRERLAKRDLSRDGVAAAVGWRSLGPTTDAGRVRDYEFTPDGSRLYVATANGGIWRLTRQGGPGSDYGSPVPLTDDLPLLTFGAVAVAPSNPNVVYAATGEQSPYSGSKVNGLGTIVSTDGGTTWRFNTQSVTGGVTSLIPSLFSYDLSVHPNDLNDVVLGTANGIFRSRDGGVSWVRKLAATPDGKRQGVNLVRHPTNPAVLWAGLWGGLAFSNDGGENWQVFFEDIAQQVGYPGSPIRSLVAMARSNPNRLYWFVAGETNDGYSQVGIFRSDDGGQNWGTALGPPQGSAYPLIAGQQGWTFLGLAVDPNNPDVVIAGGLDTWRSSNGGLSWTQISQWTLPERHPQFCHADVDVIAFEPGLSNFWMGTDGGLFRSVDSGRSFIWKNDGVVARMFSSLAQHPTDPYRLYAGTQDNGTMRLSGSSTTSWKRIFYGDGYDAAVNYQNPNVVYATNYNNFTSRADDGGEGEGSFKLTNCPASAQSFADCPFPPVTTFRSRLGMDPVDPKILYGMTDRIYKTTNGAADPSDWQPAFAQYFCSDGASDQDCPRVGKQYASCSTIAVDPKNRNRVAFGTRAGYIVYSLDRLQSARLIGIGTQVSSIVWDPNDANAMFIGLESGLELVSGQGGHTLYRLAALHTNQPTVAVADNGIGVTITYAGGTGSYFAPVDSLAVSPTNNSLMFAGTKYGIFRSTNAGASWQRFGDDFPATWVSALLFRPDGSLLRAATWGRGMWEISPQGGSPQPTSAPVPDFTFTPAAPRPGQTVTFTDRSTGGASSWSWNFGDGTSSTQQNPTKVYANEGNFNVTLTASNAAGSRNVAKSVPVSFGTTGTGDAFTYLLPVVLTSSGQGGTFFTTELTLTNRAGRTLNLTFRVKGTFEAASTYSLPAGQQIFPDVFAFLRDQTGMNVPGGNVVTSMRIEVRGADNLTQFGSAVRVTTPPTADLRNQGIIGKFGLAFPAVPVGRNARTEAFVYGLQQTSNAGQPGTRSNLACVNAGGGSGGSITLEATYFDGDTGQPHPSKDTFNLSPWQFDQRGTPLAGRGLAYGYASIRKTAGDDQFVCYGVLNDNVNGDGAFVPMTPNDTPVTTPNAIVPVIVDTAGFRSEMTFANRTSRTISGLFAVIPSSNPVPDWGYFELPPKQQFTVADVMTELRALGFAAPPGTVASVFFQFLEGAFLEDQSDTQPTIPASDGYIGVRTYATRANGLFGLAYGYSPVGTAADTEAYVYGLQQTGTRGQEGGTRSNLAVVNALGGNAENLTLEITYFGPSGQTLGSTTTTLAPGQWQQFNTPLAPFGVPHGWARIRRVSGTDQFIAYGVANDQGNDDGSYMQMVVP